MLLTQISNLTTICTTPVRVAPHVKLLSIFFQSLCNRFIKLGFISREYIDNIWVIQRFMLKYVKQYLSPERFLSTSFMCETYRLFLD